jgi:hypothetical protein
MDDDWFPEEPGQVEHGFCDQYVIHAPHTYTALNAWVLKCPGFDSEDEAYLLAQQNAEPCEHGLSASLCAGPMHYPPDM